MPAAEFRASEHVRITEAEDELLVQSREESGRGKRFGTDGEIALTPDEAERLAKGILSRRLDS
jgi:hypothetical protein